MIENPVYAVGDRVKKTSGDYVMRGTIIGVYHKTSGVCRYSLKEDNNSGLILHIDNAENLESMTLIDKIKSYLISLISWQTVKTGYNKSSFNVFHFACFISW